MSKLLRKFFLFVFVTLGMFFYSSEVKAQVNFNNTHYRVNTIYIYNFTKYIQWPGSNSGDVFVIGVLGKSPIIGELKKLAAQKTVNGKPIVVKELSSPAKNACHILYIPAQNSDKLSNCLSVSGQNTLIITEKAGLARIGSFINFVSSNGKPRFELNISALEKSNLKVLSQLKTIAILV